MTITRIGMALEIERNEDNGAIYRAVVPMTTFSLIVALTGLFVPSFMGAALVLYGAILALLTAISWLYVQIVASVIIAKIVTDCFMWVYYKGENYDYYE